MLYVFPLRADQLKGMGCQVVDDVKVHHRVSFGLNDTTDCDGVKLLAIPLGRSRQGLPRETCQGCDASESQIRLAGCRG